jgi:hypothetical protein
MSTRSSARGSFGKCKIVRAGCSSSLLLGGTGICIASVGEVFALSDRLNEHELDIANNALIRQAFKAEQIILIPPLGFRSPDLSEQIVRA